MRLDFNYSISLHSKLDPDSHFICSFGFEDTFDAAMKRAFDVLLDPAYAYITGYASSAIVRTDFVEHESAGLDYGAPDRFMIVKKQDVNNVVSVWRPDWVSYPEPVIETSCVDVLSSNSIIQFVDVAQQMEMKDMTFKIKQHGMWRNEYWRADEVNDRKKIISMHDDEYSDLDPVLFKLVLNDILDVPEYELTEENINREFGFEKHDIKIPDACVFQILEYYKFRKSLFTRICEQVLNNKAEALLSQTGCDEVTFKYYIPAKFNNFSCEEPDYTGGQVEACLEISIVK